MARTCFLELGLSIQLQAPRDSPSPQSSEVNLSRQKRTGMDALKWEIDGFMEDLKPWAALGRSSGEAVCWIDILRAGKSFEMPWKQPRQKSGIPEGSVGKLLALSPGHVCETGTGSDISFFRKIKILLQPRCSLACWIPARIKAELKSSEKMVKLPFPSLDHYWEIKGK